MNSSNSNLNPTRLELRVSPEQKALVQRAADLEGVSRTEFMINALLPAAEETIRRHDMVSLTARGSVTFVDSISNSTGPNEDLQQAYAEYLRFRAK